MGNAATGKQAIWSPVHIARFASGKIVEDRISDDQLGFLQQLGLIPVSEQVQ
jgi:predicted ester cyclase